MTPNGTRKYQVQDSFFDLDTFQEVKLGKVYTFEPVSTTADALAKLGNDSEKLIKVINDGLRAEIQRQVKADPTGWTMFDEDGELTDKPFNGTPADDKKVNQLVLTLAKTVYGFRKDMTADQKNEARAKARAMIQGNADMRDGLKESAALGSSDSADSTEVNA